VELIKARKYFVGHYLMEFFVICEGEVTCYNYYRAKGGIFKKVPKVIE